MNAWKDKRRVMHRYDLTADLYEERYREEQKAKYDAALENVKLTGGSILDVGCGTGLFFSRVAPCSSAIIGVDISRRLLLKARAEAKKWSNVFLVLADADHLPFRQGFFASVFGFTVLQNMPRPKETLRELQRVTQAEGCIVATGLKGFFPVDKFAEVLDGSGLRVSCFVDREELKCYVAVLAAGGN